MPRYRIFPAIGIARVGEDDDYFLGPEVPGSGPRDLGANDALSTVTRFKDATRTKIRKQGARFHLFESDDGSSWQPANLPPGATVTWTVTLVNKKSAVTRPNDPPIAPTRPNVPPANASMVIDGGTKQISGASAVSPPFVGTFATTGADDSAFSVDVELGRLRTDAAGRLIVLGGHGRAGAPNGTPLGGSYYRNPKWHDDVADGPVTATIRVSAQSAPIDAEGGAWVVVGPPDYAPGIECPVTLYDVIRQVGIDAHGLPAPGRPSFDLDIAPLITRVRRLRWVHDDSSWSDARLSSPQLRSRAAADKPLRKAVSDLIARVETVLEGHTDPAGPPYRLRKHQKEQLGRWVEGDFDDAAATPPTVATAVGLTRAALDGTAGQGFCPGIEAGILVLDPTIYRTPFDFRIEHASVGPGDLTALMAQPWQADFVKCNTEWWPTQRPDLAFQSPNDSDDWIRGANNHSLLVQRSGRLGFIVRQGADEVYLESERDPGL